MKTNYLLKQMKQFTFATLVAATALTSAQSFAGDRVGNGGDAVVCGDEVYMLDYVEAYGTDRSFERDGTIRELTNSIIVDSKGKDTYLYNHILASSKNFLQGIEEYDLTGEVFTKTTEFTEMKLSNLGDEGFYKIPQGCFVEQLIIRKNTSILSPQEYIVNKNLWDKMSSFQKASAVSHEATYKYMVTGGLNNSWLARVFNMRMMQKKFSKVSDREYMELRKEFPIQHEFGKDGFKLSSGIEGLCVGVSIDTSSNYNYVLRKSTCLLNEKDQIREIKVNDDYFNLAAHIRIGYSKSFEHVDWSTRNAIRSISFSERGDAPVIVGSFYNGLKAKLGNLFKLVNNKTILSLFIEKTRMQKSEYHDYVKVRLEGEELPKKGEGVFFYTNSTIELRTTGFTVRNASLMKTTFMSKKKYSSESTRTLSLTFDRNYKLLNIKL